MRLRTRDMVWFLVLGSALLLLCSCRPEVANAPLPPLSPVILAAILAHFVDKLKLQYSDKDVKKGEKKKTRQAQRIDRHIGFFVSRRAGALAIEHPEWISESDQPRLRTRIENEIGVIRAYVDQKLGTIDTPGPLGGHNEPDGPATGPKAQPFQAAPDKHLNLEDVAFVHNDTSDEVARKKRNQYVARRRKSVSDIVWRAAALHAEVWQAQGDGTTAILRNGGKVIGELLDRRLRMTERMHTQVSRRGELGYSEISAPPNSGPGKSNWKDRFRVRPFEYPRVPANSKMRLAIGDANILPPGQPAHQGDKPWRKSDDLYSFNEGPFPGVYKSPEVAPHWLQQGTTTSETYRLHMVPGSANASAVVERLFQPKFDWWERTWMFCDHVVSSLHVEALRFGLRRKNLSDIEFNQLAASSSIANAYVKLGAWVGLRSGTPPHLLADQGNPNRYFDNEFFDEDVIQVGDQLIMYNHALYSRISRGVWRLENAVVMEVNSAPDTNGIVRGDLVLQGHGTEPRTYKSYQQLIADQMSTPFKRIQDRAAAQPASATEFDEENAKIVKWDPYDDFAAPGPWWIVMFPFDDLFPTLAALKGGARKAVAREDVPGNASNPFPTPFPGAEVILFPLFEPHFPVKADEFPWHEYLKKKGDTPTFVPPRKLARVKLDGNLVPGLYRVGLEDQPIALVRPVVRAGS